jgi:hypothetical protein
VARRDSRELALSASAEAMFGDLSARDHFFLERGLREAAVAHERVRPGVMPVATVQVRRDRTRVGQDDFQRP